MIKLYIQDIEKQETRVHETTLSILQFVKVNFLAWGFYEVIKSSPKKYKIYDKFTSELEYIVFK